MNFQRRLALGMVSLTALYTGSGLALGLGDLQLQSALNQPLQALIQLHDSEGLSPADVRVSLADADTFSRVGIDRPFFLTDLSFTPVLINQQLMIRVESSRPVKEPYLNFLVQLTRSSGSLLREYTLLLDPPLYAPTPVVNSSSTPAAATVAAAPQRTAPAPVSAPRPVARTTGVPALQPQPGAERYQTVTGDSLWTIAAATRPDESIPVQRQMDAILGLNPHAFVNGDPSRLRAGQQLVLPVAEQVGATPSAPARVPSAAEAAPVIAEVPSPAQASDRLRIEEPQVLGAEAEELQNRLNIIESRFLGLLGELEQRDAQIASLQADLESLREARAVEQQSGEAVTAGLDQSVQENHAAQQAALPEQALASTPGAMGSSTGWDQPEEAQASWIERWWLGLLALLVVLIGALLLRSRRQPEREFALVAPPPVPQPITVPGGRAVDPLDGVELYLTYGRLPEARLMLDKAIAAEPRRIDLRLRLLGILAELGEVDSFAEQARQTRELGADQLQIDLIKARYPQLRQSRKQDTVQPFEEANGVLQADNETLNLDTL